MLLAGFIGLVGLPFVVSMTFAGVLSGVYFYGQYEQKQLEKMDAEIERDWGLFLESLSYAANNNDAAEMERILALQELKTEQREKILYGKLGNVSKKKNVPTSAKH